jgi:hypothetical protein
LKKRRERSERSSHCHANVLEIFLPSDFAPKKKKQEKKKMRERRDESG